MKLLQVKQRYNSILCTLLQRLLYGQSQKTCLYRKFHVQSIKAVFKLVLLTLQEGRLTEVEMMKLTGPVKSLNLNRGRDRASSPVQLPLHYATSENIAMFLAVELHF